MKHALSRLVVIGLAIIVMNAGCSQKHETSTIRIVLPDFNSKAAYASKSGDLGSLSTDDLEVVIINVSGPGIESPIVREWNRHNESAVVPTSFEIVVPKGPSRLAQVLFVFKNESVMRFYYGDSVANLSADQSTMKVAVSQIANSTSGEGTIVGRYLRADGSGPTGRVAIKFKPASDRPDMVIQRTYILGGWFNFFALQDVNFNYILERTGEALFSNVNVNSMSLLNLNDDTRMRTARISVPEHYRNRGDSSKERDSSRKIVAGFFGPGVGTQQICYHDADEAYNLSDISRDSSGYTYLLWKPNSTDTSLYALVESFVMDGGADLQGGVAGLDCSGDEFLSNVKFKYQHAVDHNQALGFEGPFKLLEHVEYGYETPVQSIYTDSSQAGKSDITLQWELLPGAIARASIAGVAGVGVFYRTGVASVDNPAYKIGNNDEIACSRLTEFGFKLHSRVAASGSSQSLTIAGISNADLDSGKFQAILCPYLANAGTEDGYIDLAAEYRRYPSNP